MSLFRPGPIPPGVMVTRPVWQAFEPAASEPELPAELPPAEPAVTPDDVLNEARLQAAQILQDAAAEAEAAMAAAQREGYQAGLAAGQADLQQQQQQAQQALEQMRTQAALIRQAAEAEAKALLAEAEAQAQSALAQARERAVQLLEEARAEQARRLDDSQGALVDLAVAAAVRLVQGHLAIQPQSVVQMVAAGLRRLKDTGCTVRVSPQDLPLLEAQRSTLERELGGGLLQLQPDASLSQGSYLVHSAQGQIDARLEQQAHHMQAALRAALGGSQA